MLKLIYLAKRKPGFTTDEFVRRWRLHGARGMEGDFWRQAVGYVQAEPIRPAPIAGASEEFDAIACYMIRDDAFDHPPSADEARRIAADELETFAGPIPAVSLWVDEQRLVDGPLGGTAVYLFFADAEPAKRAAETLQQCDGLLRLVLNLRNDGGPFGPGANTLPYAAIVEVSAASLEALGGALGPEAASLLGAADVAVVTREAVFWDRLD